MDDNYRDCPNGSYGARMGKRNYLVEGVSGTGKTAVCNELRRRGFAATGQTLARPPQRGRPQRRSR